MKIKFPSNCITAASRWSFSIKLGEALRLWHNTSCKDMSASEANKWRKNNYRGKEQIVIQGKDDAEVEAKTEKHWNAKIPDHVSNGNISYPPELNQNNEGSRAACLLELREKLQAEGRGRDDIDMLSVQVALGQAKEDAKNGTYWNPTLNDIGA